jgi:hypothetical protein
MLVIVEVEEFNLFLGGCMRKHEISVATGDPNAEVLEGSYSSEVFGWLGRCHQQAGSVGVAPGEVMPHADT